MSEIWARLGQMVTGERMMDIVLAGVILGVGLLLARSLRGAVARLVKDRVSAQSTMIAERVTFYLVFGLAALMALHQAGVNLSILLGAAGVLSVAVGFAAQTATSNLISGLFLLGESPFKVGDIIRVGTTTGTVSSIDLLSVKLRTFDNLLVRLPNESLIKSEITNLTHYPIRRFDLLVGVAYKEDVEHVRDVLMSVADANHLSLDEPKPRFVFRGYGESSLDLQFSVWAARENYLDLRTSIQLEVKKAFDAAGIEIPFPHRSLYAGSATEPFPVRVVDPLSAGVPSAETGEDRGPAV